MEETKDPVKKPRKARQEVEEATEVKEPVKKHSKARKEEVETKDPVKKPSKACQEADGEAHLLRHPCIVANTISCIPHIKMQPKLMMRPKKARFPKIARWRRFTVKMSMRPACMFPACLHHTNSRRPAATNLITPPPHITANHVYSSAYRRAQMLGSAKEACQSKAKEATNLLGEG